MKAKKILFKAAEKAVASARLAYVASKIDAKGKETLETRAKELIFLSALSNLEEVDERAAEPYVNWYNHKSYLVGVDMVGRKEDLYEGVM